ncbi:MAG: cytochrome c [Saprospiraceae bacterium]|nr:cytochrome c [Saprospiraceae bacterium]
MKNIWMYFTLPLFLASCGAPSNDGNTSDNKEAQKIDDGTGVGEIKQVTLTNPLNQQMLDRGKAIYELKCAACHRLTDQRVVGPGFLGVTERRKPEWIMNMITNVENMLVEDAAARALLEECLTRMPNQNVSIGDARDVLEFFRQNDGEE